MREAAGTTRILTKRPDQQDQECQSVLSIQFLPSQMAHDNFQVFDSTVSGYAGFRRISSARKLTLFGEFSPFLTAYLGLFYEPRVNRGQH